MTSSSQNLDPCQIYLRTPLFGFLSGFYFFLLQAISLLASMIVFFAGYLYHTIVQTQQPSTSNLRVNHSFFILADKPSKQFVFRQVEINSCICQLFGFHLRVSFCRHKFFLFSFSCFYASYYVCLFFYSIKLFDKR